MSKLPIVSSQVQIMRVEVWVTNRNGSTTETRDVVGLMDLGEPVSWNPRIIANPNNGLPSNDANNEFRTDHKRSQKPQPFGHHQQVAIDGIVARYRILKKHSPGN